MGAEESMIRATDSSALKVKSQAANKARRGNKRSLLTQAKVISLKPFFTDEISISIPTAKRAIDIEAIPMVKNASWRKEGRGI